MATETNQSLFNDQQLVFETSNLDRKITFGSATGTTEGIEIEYDRLTSAKQFTLTPAGAYWTDGVDTYTTSLARLAVVQQAFQAVELPPNATTLEVNKTLNLDDQVGNVGSIGLNGVNTEITATGDLILNPTGSIDANGKTLNMTAGEIHNCPLIHSQNNNDITIESKGTGDLILKTGNTNRLGISDTGDWTINGGVGTSGQVLTSGGAGVSPSWTTPSSSVILPSWTTATRPSPPTNYQMGWNTTSSYPEIYTGSTWASFSILQPTSITLSAGFSTYATIVYVDSANNIVGSAVVGGSTIYIFQDTSLIAPGTTRTGTITPNFSGTIEYLVVAGGGGGGGSASAGDGAGGGGAGGYLTGSLSVVSATSYTITAGAGGAGGSGVSGTQGSNSVFSSITADGGGGGGSSFAVGGNGGSGGGGGTRNSASGGTATAGQGNNGGASLAGNTPGTALGGGGGGSGSVGASGSVSGNGGSGTTSTISGTSTTYTAGGGGGGYDRAGGSGVSGVSGNGASNAGGNGGNGTNGRGGGGGGSATAGITGVGGNGGSGVVIIKFSSYL